MNKLFLYLALVVIAAAPSQAVVLTFDDISSSGRVSMSNSYAGFSWHHSWAVQTYSFYEQHWSNSMSPVSLENHLINQGNDVNIVTQGDDFIFDGAYLTGFSAEGIPRSYTPSSLSITGWNNGVQVASFTADLTVGTMLYFATGWDVLVDTVLFDAPTGGWFLMDNFTYNTPQGDPEIPEPASMLLLGVGLLGGAAIRRRCG